METATDESLPPVTVIMPVRNEGNHICRSLDAVLDQDYPADRLEVLVADGMSRDATRDRVRARQAGHPNLRLLDNPRQIVASGLNAALAQARGEIIVRVDGHTVIAADYVRQCVMALARSGAENAGGRMLAQGTTRF